MPLCLPSTPGRPAKENALPERPPDRRFPSNGLLKWRKTGAAAAAAPSPRPAAPRATTVRIPVSPPPAALLPLPEGFDLSPEAAAYLEESGRNPAHRAG
ncbi:hypothetical protein GCM10023220_11260 [Streptomyces ziwulingensis]|uniref:Uncharacterized protein n=1 Tax=Streptomyces ziwulingensis TaxID=1045501 RepID=A0ABP9AZP2_9ACTN